MDLNADDRRIIWRAMEALEKLKNFPDQTIAEEATTARRQLEHVLAQANRRVRE